MKKFSLTQLTVMLAFFASIAFLSSCSKEETNPASEKNSATYKTVAACEPVVFPLTAGQTIDIGNLTVSNDETNLYVTYNATEGTFGTLHLNFYSTQPTSKGSPGQYDYSYNATGLSTYTFTIALADLIIDGNTSVGADCEDMFYILAHAEYGEETAFGGDIFTNPGGGAWFYTAAYNVCCSEEELCYQDHSSWSAGSRYVTKGNWATYTQFSEGASVTLWAGQTNNAGTVTFATEGSNVRVTVTLNSGFIVNTNTNDNFYVQGYATAPTTSPIPGSFAYKTKETASTFSALVPAANFYGVHVNVRMVVPCI